jgi:hypothetical protein
MSTHKSNKNTWEILIKGSEEAIQTCRDRIKELNKSLIFFKKQKEAGVPFPYETNKKRTHIKN